MRISTLLTSSSSLASKDILTLEDALDKTIHYAEQPRSRMTKMGDDMMEKDEKIRIASKIAGYDNLVPL